MSKCNSKFIIFVVHKITGHNLSSVNLLRSSTCLLCITTHTSSVVSLRGHASIKNFTVPFSIQLACSWTVVQSKLFGLGKAIKLQNCIHSELNGDKLTKSPLNRNTFRVIQRGVASSSSPSAQSIIKPVGPNSRYLHVVISLDGDISGINPDTLPLLLLHPATKHQIFNPYCSLVFKSTPSHSSARVQVAV